MKRNLNKKECSICGELFHPGILWRHEKFCSGVKKQDKKRIILLDESWKQDSGLYKCPYCDKEYIKNGICSHIYKKHTIEGKKQNPNIGYLDGSRKAWNKGLTKETDGRLKKQGKTLSKKFQSGELVPHTKGKTLSDETRKKIGKSRSKYLVENPEKVPYRLNHSSKKSYPEELFENELIKRNISGWIYNYPAGIYQYDFAWPDLKIDVEIDGATHKQDKVRKIDERRDKFSEDNGWKVIRFPASKVKNDINSCFDELQKYL